VTKVLFSDRRVLRHPPGCFDLTNVTGVSPGHDVGAVAQHFLYGADVGALLERRLRKAVAEEVPMESGDPTSLFQAPHHRLIRPDCYGIRAGTSGCNINVGRLLPARQFPISLLLCDAVQIATERKLVCSDTSPGLVRVLASV
jgi:hypothetical protein